MADAISRLDKNAKATPLKTMVQQMCISMRLFTCTKQSKESHAKSVAHDKASADVDSKVQFPLELKRVAHAQKGDEALHAYIRKDAAKPERWRSIKSKVINDVEVLMYNDQIYVPASLRQEVL